ncbi:MAG TPA: choice-of-anchor V domain-containing protein [Bacteroidia bacterium]|nr:choice-of-anchor V domain-containing protein [Bacteroidia bacterium]
MNKKVILPLISGAAILVLSASTVINAAGTYAWSGSPVDGGTSGGTCSSCHNGGSATPTVSVSASPAFGGTGNNVTYTPGATYTISVTAGGTYSKYGFNCEIINSQSATTTSVTDFGTFGAAVGTNTQIFPASGNQGYPTSASHSGPAAAGAFKFKWTAPASGTGYIYADVLGCNNNNQTTGDKTSAVASLTLTAASGAGINTHAENVNSLSVFPNPATDNVRITYTLKERATVSIKLYNLSGDLVADLLNSTQDVGIQSNDAHLPNGLAKGLYMVKLMVNGQQSTQKLMIY